MMISLEVEVLIVMYFKVQLVLVCNQEDMEVAKHNQFQLLKLLSNHLILIFICYYQLFHYYYYYVL